MRNKLAIQQRGKAALESQVEWKAERAVKLTSQNAVCVLTWGALHEPGHHAGKGWRGLPLLVLCRQPLT